MTLVEGLAASDTGCSSRHPLPRGRSGSSLQGDLSNFTGDLSSAASDLVTTKSDAGQSNNEWDASEDAQGVPRM